MRECERKQSLCGCINWKKDDLALQVNHLMNNFEFTGFELEYTTLGPEDNRRLCRVGRCRACGKRLCIGTRLPTQDTVDGLLAKICHWTYQMWKGPGEKLPDGMPNLRDMFLALFHEEDRGLVREWLSRPGNPNVHQMYRNSNEEVW